MKVWELSKKILGIGLLCLPLTMSTSLTGCLTDDDKDTTKNDTDTVKVELVTSKTVEVGAQANASLGSFVDLDNYTVLKLTEAKANSEKVDLIFAYSGSASSSAVYSPHAAKAGISGGPGLTIAKDLPSANTTELRAIDAAKFDTVKSVAALEALFNAGTPASPVGRLLVSKDYAFGAKTAGGKIVGMKVTAVTTDTTGNATILGKAKF